jgi:hypothetical protein
MSAPAGWGQRAAVSRAAVYAGQCDAAAVPDLGRVVSEAVTGPGGFDGIPRG